MIKALYDKFVTALAAERVPLYMNDEERVFLQQWLEGAVQPESPASESAAPVEADDLKIRERIKGCVRCQGAGGKKYPFGSGANRVMVLLNMPQKISEYERNLYKKSSFDVMTKMMHAIKLSLDECYITNMIKCDSGATDRPSTMYAECTEILREELETMAPQAVVVMGAFAPVAKMSRSFPAISWFTIEHPITLVKNPDMKRAAWETLKLVRARLDQGAATE